MKNGLHRPIALFRFCNLPSDVICWSPNPTDTSKYVGNPRMFVSSLISAHLNFIDDGGYRSNGRDLSQHLTALCPSTLSQHLQNYRANVNFSKNGWQPNSCRITSLLVLEFWSPFKLLITRVNKANFYPTNFNWRFDFNRIAYRWNTMRIILLNKFISFVS
jgi:hypothetical protein